MASLLSLPGDAQQKVLPFKVQGCWKNQAPGCNNTLSTPPGTESGSDAPEPGSPLMGRQLDRISWEGSCPRNGATEQQKQVFRVVPALPPFFAVGASAGWASGWLGSNHAYWAERESLLGVPSPSPNASTGELTPLCGLENTLGSQGKLRDVGKDVQYSVQTETSCSERGHEETRTPSHWDASLSTWLGYGQKAGALEMSFPQHSEVGQNLPKEPHRNILFSTHKLEKGLEMEL